ncbi:hypothetical protein [Streptosporangium sp. NPDC002524]|uniref:hypothetical protein n=1 Tax=Streptosporangium sp. NPDC002524 TaxID=3154537 RepID=UPI0033269BE1
MTYGQVFLIYLAVAVVTILIPALVAAPGMGRWFLPITLLAFTVYVAGMGIVLHLLRIGVLR